MNLYYQVRYRKGTMFDRKGSERFSQRPRCGQSGGSKMSSVSLFS